MENLVTWYKFTSAVWRKTWILVSLLSFFVCVKYTCVRTKKLRDSGNQPTDKPYVLYEFHMSYVIIAYLQKYIRLLITQQSPRPVFYFYLFFFIVVLCGMVLNRDCL